MIYVTSDLHGCDFEKFMSLLRLAEFSDDDFLFVLGDVIDRGSFGIDILRWLMTKSNAQLILGNHEAMLLSCAFLFDEVTEENISSFDAQKMKLYSSWIENGGEPTVEALRKLSIHQRRDIIDYLKDCTLYERVRVSERDFVLVHAGLGNYSDKKALEDYTVKELLGCRPSFDDEYSNEFTTILGHTPTGYYSSQFRGRMIKRKTWIDIDTGAAGGLDPMLLRLDDMKEFYLTDM